MNLNKFFKDSILYVFADALNKLAIFLLIPIYTSVFTTHEYGVLEQITIISTFMNILVSFASKTSFLRLSFNYKEEEKKSFLFTILVFISLIALGLLILNFLATMAIEIGKYKVYIYYIIFYTYFLSINQISLTLLRTQKKVFAYSILNILKTILELSMIILFIKYLNLGIIGKLQASLIASILLIIVIYKFYLFKNIKLQFNKLYLLNYLNFAKFLVLHQFFGWLLISYDKILINKSFSTKELGIYALGLQVLAIFKFISESALKAFNIEIFSNPKVIYKYFESILLFIISIVVLFSLVFSFFSRDIILILANEKYLVAENIVKYFVLSRVIMIYNFVLVMILYMNENSKPVLHSTYIGIVSSLIFSSYLIPNFHFVGAAISTTIVYTIIAFFLTKEVQKYIKFHITIQLFTVIILLLLSIYISIFIKIDLLYKGMIFVIYLIGLSWVNKPFMIKVYKHWSQQNE